MAGTVGAGEPGLRASRGAPGRVIGRFRGTAPGPRVLIVAGMHGNEWAGVTAASNVLDRLERAGEPVRGEIIALAGNLRALGERRRYIATDMNRLWTRDRVAALRDGGAAPADVEFREQHELLALLDAFLAEPAAESLVVDLHTTSGPGAPFTCISDTLRSRAIALDLPIPLVLGLEEAIAGTLLEHMEEEGQPLLLLEGGAHEDVATVENLESALWLVLVNIGTLDRQAVPAFRRHRDRLAAAARGLPRVIEVTYRHAAEDGDAFRMRGGFRHFDRIRRGQTLADDAGGPIDSPETGMLIMPRYQKQGNDGFFIGRAVRRKWLDVSRWARRARLDRVLPRLPGVSRDPLRPHRLLVDRRVARWLTVQIFHLGGFRRLPDRDGKLVFTRRIEPDR